MSLEESGSSFTCGLLIGAVLGAMGALVLAPRSGAELRSELEQTRRRLRETRARTVSELRESGREAREAYDKARGSLSEAAAELKQAARGVVKSNVGSSRAKGA